MTAPSAAPVAGAPLTGTGAGAGALSPALAWLVGRAGLDEDAQAAVRAADATALATSAAIPVPSSPHW